jgi:hypothetical protein
METVAVVEATAAAVAEVDQVAAGVVPLPKPATRHAQSA